MGVTGARTLAASGHQQSPLHGLGAMVSSDVSLNGALSSSSSPPQCAGTPACDPESDSNLVGWDHKLKDVELGIAGDVELGSAGANKLNEPGLMAVELGIAGDVELGSAGANKITEPGLMEGELGIAG